MSRGPTAAQRIGAALCAYRGDRTVTSVAAKAGISRRTLQYIERGRRIATEETLASVIAALGAWDVPELASICAETLPRHQRLMHPETGARLWLRAGEPPLSEVTVLVRAMRGGL